MASAATRALVWAKALRAPADIRGAALTLAMESKTGDSGDTVVYEGSAETLQDLLGACCPDTIRRYIAYLECVGFLTRVSGQGSRNGLRIRLCLETPIDSISERIDEEAHHTHQTRVRRPPAISREVEPPNALREDSPAISREVAETSQDISGSETESVLPSRARDLDNVLTPVSLVPGNSESTSEIADAISAPRRARTPVQQAIGAVCSAIKARGWNRYQTNPRDNAAIKQMPGLVLDSADDIADCWKDLLAKRWGSEYDQSHVAVHRIITELLPSYQAWKASGSPPPRRGYSNGHASGQSWQDITRIGARPLEADDDDMEVS